MVFGRTLPFEIRTFYRNFLHYKFKNRFLNQWKKSIPKTDLLNHKSISLEIRIKPIRIWLDFSSPRSFIKKLNRKKFTETSNLLKVFRKELFFFYIFGIKKLYIFSFISTSRTPTHCINLFQKICYRRNMAARRVKSKSSKVDSLNCSNHTGK